jgi:hypothetical protein
MHLLRTRIALFLVSSLALTVAGCNSATPSPTSGPGAATLSSSSLTENRELGLTLTDPAILLSLHNTLASDFQGAAVWP